MDRTGHGKEGERRSGCNKGLADHFVTPLISRGDIALLVAMFAQLTRDRATSLDASLSALRDCERT
jgi:hypothetical protein